MPSFVLLALVLSLGLVCVSSSGGRQLVGGWSDDDIDSKNAQAAAEFATSEISKQSNSLFHKKLFQIVSVRKQIVAGTKYHIVMETQHTQCKKNDVSVTDPKNCDANNDLPIEVCTVEVWTKVWEQPPHHLLKSSCETKKKTEVYTHREHFKDFVTLHRPQGYETKKEYEYRFRLFQNNLKRIKLLNEQEQGTATYGVTKFADLSAKEFKRFYLGLKPSLDNGGSPVVNVESPKNSVGDLPVSFDWRDKGAVTEVKNQETCGSCWAFSTTGNVEGQWFLKKGELLSLSEQELVDCDTLDQGCNGGLPSNAYQEIQKLGGLELEKDYPYTGRDGKCSFDKKLAKVTVNGYVNVSQDETQMADFLVNTGPISIGINANAMQFYFGGVSHPLKFLCNPNNLDHGVLIVGYGVHNYPLFNTTLPFWTIKNSWGANWGEQGYYRVYRGDGTCGLNLMATSAVID